MLSLTQRYTQQDINENFEERELRAAPALIESVAKVESSNDYMRCELRNRNSSRIKVDIFRLMLKISGKGHLGDSAPLIGKYAASLLAAALASGRCYFCPEMGAPHSGALDLLRTGPARPGEITWQANTRQQIVPNLVTQPPSRTLRFLEPP